VTKNDKPLVSLASAARTLTPSTSGESPEHAVRAIVEPFVKPDSLPPHRMLTLHYIRGVGNDKYLGGEDRDTVIYGPEFLYVLDVGFPMMPGVEIGFRTIGKGDPHFPDFSKYQIWSVQSLGANHLLFPAAVGQLLVGVEEGTAEEKVRKELATYATKIEVLIPNLYLAYVRAFREPEIAAAMERNVEFVRYAQLNHRTRLIDFLPGWFVDRIC
jgi:hypothetical protein